MPAAVDERALGRTRHFERDRQEGLFHTPEQRLHRRQTGQRILRFGGRSGGKAEHSRAVRQAEQLQAGAFQLVRRRDRRRGRDHHPAPQPERRPAGILCRGEPRFVRLLRHHPPFPARRGFAETGAEDTHAHPQPQADSGRPLDEGASGQLRRRLPGFRQRRLRRAGIWAQEAQNLFPVQRRDASLEPLLRLGGQGRGAVLPRQRDSRGVPHGDYPRDHPRKGGLPDSQQPVRPGADRAGAPGP